jgi:uncharacterized protein (TIGR03435 family)
MKTTIFASAVVSTLYLGTLLLGADQQRFEVASVKRADQCEFRTSLDPGLVTLRGVPLKPVLAQAYKVKADHITGPSWLETDCYEIVAKMPKDATLERLPDLLQALLSDRFKIAARTEDRAHQGYALVVDKGGLKLKEHDPKGNFMGTKRGLTLFGAPGHGRLQGAMTMASLANYLSSRGYGAVQDSTGLAGQYDVDLTWVPDQDFEPRAADSPGPASTPPSAGSDPSGASLFSALRESLGLRLERREISEKYLVIDKIERLPTEN